MRFFKAIVKFESRELIFRISWDLLFIHFRLTFCCAFRFFYHLSISQSRSLHFYRVISTINPNNIIAPFLPVFCIFLRFFSDLRIKSIFDLAERSDSMELEIKQLSILTFYSRLCH